MGSLAISTIFFSLMAALFASDRIGDATASLPTALRGLAQVSIGAVDAAAARLPSPAEAHLVSRRMRSRPPWATGCWLPRRSLC
jgi:hypothetical protein